MPHDFKYKSEKEYLLELTTLLKEEHPGLGEEYPKYEDLMNEFMEFCEVSGSGK